MTGAGAVGDVYRAPLRNENGDPVDDDGNVVRSTNSGLKVGTLTGITLGGLSASPSLARQDSSNTSGQIGIDNRNTFKVQLNDRILINGDWYKVVSPPRWDYPNSLSTTKPKCHWVQVEATTGQP